MDPVTIAALIGGGASLLGSASTNRSQEKAADQMEQQRVANMGLIKDYGQRAIESLTPSYQNAQNIRQQALNQNLGLAGSTFQPMMQSMQTGDYMAQQSLLAGLMGQRNAILGDPINYGALQAQSVPVDYSALTGVTNPQGMDFTKLETPEFSKGGQMDWSAFDAQNYLAANPDIKADYEANKASLLAGGDPQFRTAEGYAKWHYDNYGKAEGRPTTGQAAQTAPQAVFTSEQVRNAISRMGGESL